MLLDKPVQALNLLSLLVQSTKAQILTQNRYAARQARPGTQFPCFTSTKAQILTQKRYAARQARRGLFYVQIPPRVSGNRNLLALLVQKYKY